LPHDRHGERLQCDFGVQRLAHRPADDLAGMQIQYGGEVKPAFAGGDVGQVGKPNLAGSMGDKVAARDTFSEGYPVVSPASAMRR
jgi:hypothetical protein